MVRRARRSDQPAGMRIVILVVALIYGWLNRNL
jgi:hypothetical protein